MSVDGRGGMRMARSAAARRGGLAAVVFAASLVPLRRRSVGPREEAIFRSVNDAPDALRVPAWLVMQLGTVGAAPAAALVARRCGRPRLAMRVLLGGVGTWAASKVVKRLTRRPRPASLVAGTNVRGREAAGLGYPSGHAGVAVVLGAAAWGAVDARGRVAVAVAVPIVGLTRMYVGAHLPLDVVSGAALGLAIDAAVDGWLGDEHCAPSLRRC